MGKGSSDTDESDDDSEDQDIQIQIKQKKKKKKQKKEKKKKAPPPPKKVTITDRHAATMDFNNDGIGTSGRVGIFCGQCALAFFLVGLVSENWTNVQNMGTGKLLEQSEGQFSDLRGVNLGIWRLCFDADVKNMNYHSRSVCFWHQQEFSLSGFQPRFEYKSNKTWEDCQLPSFEDREALEICLKQGDTCPEIMKRNKYCEPATSVEQDICKHLNAIDYCGKRSAIMWISIALVVLLIFADLFSEKILINGVVCFLAAGCGAAMMGMWLEVYSELEKQTDGGGVEHGEGFTFMVLGFVAAMLGAIFCALDIICVETERFGCNNDGIQVIGRSAALMGVLVWVLFTAGIFMADWATTDGLGFVEGGDGPHFEKFGLAQVGKAQWGLWNYCLELNVTLFGGPQPVCMEAKEVVEFDYQQLDTEGNVLSQNGCDIFQTNRYCERAQICVCSSIVAAIVGFTGDMFSEKQAVNAAMLFFTFAAGVVNMIFWLLFVLEIDGPKPYAAASEVTIGPGFYTTIIATSFSLIGAILFYLDFADLCELPCEKTGYELGKTADELNDCLCYLCNGTGGTGYDGKNDGKSDR